MAQLRVVVLWHQHQPFYKDLVTGLYRLPWTRLHALKDYYGMVKLLDEFPQVHQTFNLVPSLIAQIGWFDEYFVAEPEVAELIRKGRNYTLEDQRFLIARERELLGRVLPAHAEAAKKGLIEISTSPFYHPILPLVCDTQVGAVSSPGLALPQNRYRHPEDAREQLLR